MNNESRKKFNSDSIPPEEEIESEPSRNIGEIIALVSDGIRTRIEELKDVFPGMTLDQREQALAVLMAELDTADQIGLLAGIEPDLLEELEKITDSLSDD